MLAEKSQPAQEIFRKMKRNGFSYPLQRRQIFSWIIHAFQIVGGYVMLYPFFDSLLQVRHN